MFCKECGQLLSEGAKFCPECGDKVNEMNNQKEKRVDTQTERQMKPRAEDMDQVKHYFNEYIKSTTTFITVEDFLKNSKPLRFRIPLIAIGACFYLIGAVVGWLISGVICMYKMVKRNNKRYALNRSIDLDDLATFLSESLAGLPFEAWQRGTPSYFGFKDDQIKVIQFAFEGKTIHRIEIKNDNSSYAIKVHKVTRKSYWKNGGQTSIALLYKNAYKTQPVIEGAIKYYLENH